MYKKIIIGVLLIITLSFTHYQFYYFVADNKTAIKSALSWKNKAGISPHEKELLGLETYQHDYRAKSTDLGKILNTAFSLKDRELCLITSADISKKGTIRIIFSYGFLLELNNNGQVQRSMDFKPAIKNIYVDDNDAGVRGAVWLSEHDAAVFHSIGKPGKLGIAISTLRFSDKSAEMLSQIKLADLPDYSDGVTGALGGGITLLAGDVYLALGAGAENGDYVAHQTSQSDDNVRGHVLKIKIEETDAGYLLKDIVPFTKGHRNPQGLKIINGHIMAVEHGPRGGDEVNVIKRGGNYGWPKYSHGIPYDVDVAITNYRSPGTFVSPLYYFTPSIGISDLTSCPFKDDELYANCIVVSSMRGGVFIILKVDNTSPELKIVSSERFNVGERIRKIVSDTDKLYLFTDGLLMHEIEFVKTR